jgi:hypothetical protein
MISSLGSDCKAGGGLRSAALSLLFLGMTNVMAAWSKDADATESKHIIGATAIITEAKSGISFPARVDTGAKSCSLHVEKIEIEDKTSKRVRNVGKKIRFLVKGSDGKTHWLESEIAAAVRVKSPSLKAGEYDHRYKVKLTLAWEDFSKEVLVSLNDRTDMEYPLLIGRNYLRGDFLVDVAKSQTQK